MDRYLLNGAGYIQRPQRMRVVGVWNARKVGMAAVQMGGKGRKRGRFMMPWELCNSLPWWGDKGRGGVGLTGQHS